MKKISLPRKFGVTIGLLLLAILLVWGGLVAYRAIRLVQTAQAAVATLQERSIDFARAKAALVSTTADVNDLQDVLSPAYPLLRPLSSLPWIGAPIGQVEPLITFSNELTRAATILVEVFDPVLQPLPGDQLSLTERLSRAILSSPARLDEADRLLQQAALESQKIDPDILPSRYRDYFIRLNRLIPILKTAIPALKQVPGLLGGDIPQDYLVLAQNRDELRPTGGFISGIGTVSLHGGRLAAMNIGDSYAIDDFSKPYPTPPAPLKQYMLADYWVTRDGNWSPDFPTAAARVQELYTLSTGVATRGVFAFDQLAVKGMLKIIGPVQIDSYPNPISAATVEEFMHQAWAPDPKGGVTETWWANRKKFMGELGKVILTQLMAPGSSKNMAGLAAQLLDLVQAGHILVYIDQPEIKALLQAASLDGAVTPAGGDFLYLVDSNIGFNKVDTVIKRQLIYAVNLSDLKNLSARITASYQHTVNQAVICKQEATYGNGTYADMQARCYWDYWRIYRPAGSQLTASDIPPISASQLLNAKDWPGLPDITEGEKGTAVIGGLLVVPTAAASSFSLSTSLPASVIKPGPQGNWIYTLRIPKQPGLDSLQVVVSIQLPPGMNVRNPEEGWEQDLSGQWTWSGTLQSVKDFQLQFGQP